MELFISGCTIIEINNEIAEKTIVIRKRNKIKTPDAIIAATAIVHHLTLITSDNGFNNIAGLMVLNPNAL
jgi:predicted nucleic acid-binding protein